MSPVATLGAALAVLTAAAHSYLGERYILVRLFQRPDLPHLFGSDRFTRRTLRLAWHVTSVAWCGLAVLLVGLARQASVGMLGATVGATFAATGLVILVGSRGRHLAWPVFFVIAVAAWYSTR